MDDKSAGDELLVSQLEHRSHEAFLARDTEALDRILADDFIFTDPEGNLVTKADWIAEIGSGDLTFEAIHTDDLQIRIYGDAAVTFGRVTMKGRSTKEGDFHASYCYTAMYVKQDGRWQAVAEQANLLPEQ
jgi:ketosteroid isomerase-like protein